MYSLIKKLLFLLPPETAHDVTLKTLKLAEQLKITHLFPHNFNAPKQVMGLQFKNPVGLAAGLDKNGDYIDALAALGFGFVEVGTVTRQPQPGNKKPRLFRLEPQEALINRMGFNSKGVDYLIARLKQTKYRGILGINIGKNRDTPLENALQDYLYLFRTVASYASYVTINISSPNTEKLRDLQQGELLHNLLHILKTEQAKRDQYIPLVVKISPDVTLDELKAMAAIFLAEKIDGVIATNTTVSRVGVEDSIFVDEAGGLSGKPLTSQANHIIKNLHELLQNKIPIIGCGGIMNAEDAKNAMDNGAELVQIYTGFIYRGPQLIKEIILESNPAG